MGTALTGNTIASSYLGLLKSTDSLAIGTSAKRITDGAGNDLPIKLTTTQMFFNVGSVSAPALSFDGNSSEGFYMPDDETLAITLGANERVRFFPSGKLKLNNYGGGSFTGTVTQRLGVTSSGEVVEIPIGSGAVDGSGTAGKLAKFTDSDTLGDSLLTESTNSVSLADNKELILGNDSDLTIKHSSTGNQNSIKSDTHQLFITSDVGMELADNGGKSYFEATEGGSSRLFFNNSKKIETTNTGADITGTITTTGSVSVGDSITLADNNKIKLGSSADLEIYHDGSNSYIDEGGTGGLLLESNSYIYLQTSNGGAYTGRFINGGAVELYHNGNKKFSTTSTGTTTTGDGIFTGSVAIGGTSPDESLHITNSSGANIILNSDANTADSGIYMSEGADATPTQNGAYLHYDASANEFKIATGGSSLTDRFTIARDTGNATFAGDVFVSQSNTDAVPTNNLSGDELLNISNNDNSGVYSALKFRTRTSGAAHSLVGLRMDSDYTDAKFFIRLRNAGLTSQEVFNVGNTGATFAGNLALNGLTNSDFDADADNLVLGASSGNAGLTIFSGSSANNFGSIYFADGTTTTAKKAGFIRYEQNTSEMTFGINAVQKLNIALDGTATFSGNVLIGKTANAIGGAGVVIRKAGEIFSTRAGDVAGFNRLTTDGNIVQFYKDGSVVGAIGTQKWGIGEANPDLQLHIKNTATGNTGIAIENTNNAQNLDIDFYSNAGSAQGRIRYEEGAGAFNFSPNVSSPNAMYINFSNNIGIGTTSPKHYSGTTGTVLSIDSATHRGILELSGASNSDEAIIGAITFANTENTSANGALSQIFTYTETSDSNAGDDSGGHLAFLTRPEAGTITERMRIDSSGQITNTMSGGTVSTDINGHITSFQTLDTATAGGRFIGKSNRGVLGSIHIEQTTTSADGGYIGFETSPSGSTTPTERMRLDSSGRLGIGITPADGFNSARLNLGTGAVSSEVIAFATASGGNAELRNTSNTGTFSITNNDGGTTLMTILANGNVGIGNTSPTRPLDVTADSGAVGIKIRARSANDFAFLSFTQNDGGGTAFAELAGLGSGGGLRIDTAGSESMRITSDGVVQCGLSTAGVQSTAKLTSRVNGSAIEFGHTNVSDYFFGTLGSYGSNGEPFLSFSCMNEQNANTWTTKSTVGNIIQGNNSGHLVFQQVTSTNTTGQTPTERMRITSGGQVCIGTTSTTVSSSVVSAVFGSGSDVTLKLGGHSGTHTMMQFLHTGTVVGSVSSTTSATSYNTSSDYRLKEDLQDFNALDIASKIKMYDFKWKEADSRSYGVLAHELQEVVPQAVSGDKDAEEMQQVDYSKLVPILLKSIQELEARVQELEKEI